MGEKTSIAWCHATFNPWWGCTKISPGCKHCYAATFDKRVGGDNWKPDGPRRFFGDKHWNEPVKWDRAAAKVGERRRVFCASMADVFEDRRDLDEHRARLWKLIETTPNLDWLLLTKRPDVMRRLWPWTATPPNVWAGATMENQEHANARMLDLLSIPAVVRFASCEPLLGPIEIGFLGALPASETGGAYVMVHDRLNWIIVGAESGPGARSMATQWARDLRDQCASVGAAFLLKQAVEELERPGGAARLHQIGAGDGSTRKGPKLIELPYLDGAQHAAFPEPGARHAGRV